EADRKTRGPKPKPPEQLQVFTSNVTVEALGDLLNENKRGLLLYRDELTGWAKSNNMYRAGRGDDKENFLSIWAGVPFSVNRRGRRVYVETPFLSVCGNLPPAVLGDLNDEHGREDGWIHRILFTWPDEGPGGWSDEEPDPAT